MDFFSSILIFDLFPKIMRKQKIIFFRFYRNFRGEKSKFKIDKKKFISILENLLFNVLYKELPKTSK